jgi:predicted transglutaminase-like cysteine proteinase
MSAIARGHGAARWLLVLMSLGFTTTAAAVDSDATPESDKFARANEPFVIALATSAPSVPSAVPPPATVVPLISNLPAPAPARFFTINEVLAKRIGPVKSDPPIKFASVDAGHTATDANTSVPSSRNYGDEPFGLFTFVAPDGQLWTKWRNVADDVRAEEPALVRCLADPKQCSPAAAHFSAIVNDAREQKGRARLDLVNQRVNTAIRYKSDMAQWGVPDLWSPPLAANNTGSFSTGFGDCEDFAIAKYVALRAAGVPAPQLRIMLVHDNMARMDHAVLAALYEGHWLILDNRWMTLVEDTEAKQFVPLFALNDQGVKLLAVPYAAKQTPISEAAEIGNQMFVPGGEAIEQTPMSFSDGMTGTGSAPILL